jgi:N-acyl-D-aspartate/D-glutamate deacylase
LRQEQSQIGKEIACHRSGWDLCTPNSITQLFTLKNCQLFRGVPTWHPILLASDDEKLRAYSDPEVRAKLQDEAVDRWGDIKDPNFAASWYDYMWVEQPALPKNAGLTGKSIGELASDKGKSIVDAFLDLAVEENLETAFLYGENNVDKDAMTQILNYSNAYIGLSDGGAHVQAHGGYGYSTRLLGY